MSEAPLPQTAEAIAAALRAAHGDASQQRSTLVAQLRDDAIASGTTDRLADAALLLLATLRKSDGSLDMVAAELLRRYGRPDQLDALRALRPKLRPRIALRDWRFEVDRAIATLEARSEGRCSCTVDAAHGAPIVDRDHERLADHTDRERYAIVWQVRCRSCRRRWEVVEQHGYHYPTFAWSGSDADG